MSSFEDRISRIEAKRAAAVAPQAVEPNLVGTRSNNDIGLRQSSINPFRAVFAIIFGAFLGALSVLIGGVARVAFYDGGLTPDTMLPPDLAMVGVLCALILATLADRIVGMGRIGMVAVTVGYVGMLLGEQFLVGAFPQAWVTIYDAQYLPEPIRPESYFVLVGDNVTASDIALKRP